MVVGNAKANGVTSAGTGNSKTNHNSTQQTNSQPSAWANRTATAHLKSALTNARNPSAMGSAAPHPAAPTNPSNLANQFGQMNIQNPSNPNANSNTYNPSVGPSPSMFSTNWRSNNGPPSQSSTSSFRQAVNNVVCKLSNFTRRDFRQGDLISLPFHQANSNPNVDPNTDKHWTMTIEGPAYSKRRMMVVMWIHKRDMFCLPLYTHGGTGLQNKPAHIKNEYVSMKNVGDKNFFNQGLYPPVEVQCRYKPMDPNTTVWITGGMKVGCNEDIAPVGRMTRKSYAHLLQLWQSLSDAAQKEPWRD